MRHLQKVLILILLTNNLIQAQGVFSNETTTALQKVIQDYPNRFRNIRGALLTTYPEATDYQSTIEIPGAVNAVISQYQSSNKELCSWKAVLYSNEEFEEATRKYKELFSQISNTIIKVEGEKPFILNGKFESPVISRRLTCSVFQVLPASFQLQQLSIELTLQHSVTEWKIQLAVYDREGKRQNEYLAR